MFFRFQRSFPGRVLIKSAHRSLLKFLFQIQRNGLGQTRNQDLARFQFGFFANLSELLQEIGAVIMADLKNRDEALCLLRTKPNYRFLEFGKHLR